MTERFMTGSAAWDQILADHLCWAMTGATENHAEPIDGDEQDYFSRRVRKLIRWHPGEGRLIKRKFWKRQRADGKRGTIQEISA